MKIFLIIFFFTFFLKTTDILSQAYNPNKIGFFIGPTLSNVSIDISSTSYNVDNKNKIGFTTGVSVDLFTSERFILYSELYFNRKTGESKVSFFGNFPEVKYDIDYLSYDISARYDFAGKTVIPFVFLGPRIDFYLSDEIKTNSSTIPFPVSQNRVSEKIKRVGMGLSGGIGLEFYTGNTFSIQTAIQFSPSFYDIYKDEIISVKSNSFEFKVGSRF